MAGFPVTIRLLDPPLHEFLPALEEATSDDDARGGSRELHEANPMLGTRGCRLGLQWPEIYEMQVRAIVRAASGGRRRGPATRRSSRSCTRSSASARSCRACGS